MWSLQCLTPCHGDMLPPVTWPLNQLLLLDRQKSVLLSSSKMSVHFELLAWGRWCESLSISNQKLSTHTHARTDSAFCHSASSNTRPVSLRLKPEVPEIINLLPDIKGKRCTDREPCCACRLSVQSQQDVAYVRRPVKLSHRLTVVTARPLPRQLWRKSNSCFVFLSNPKVT